MKKNNFKNKSGLEFTNISSEKRRVYEFLTGAKVEIVEPQFLNVSKSGGHRIFDSAGVSHYVPSGWVHLYWEVKPNQPNFVK